MKPGDVLTKLTIRSKYGILVSIAKHLNTITDHATATTTEHPIATLHQNNDFDTFPSLKLNFPPSAASADKPNQFLPFLMFQ